MCVNNQVIIKIITLMQFFLHVDKKFVFLDTCSYNYLFGKCLREMQMGNIYY